MACSDEGTPSVVLGEAKDLIAVQPRTSSLKEHRYWVYIITSSSLSAMYIGVTNDLGKRVVEHRSGVSSEFVKKYKVTKLVHAEEFELIEEAIAREKQLEGWKRIHKNELVRATNPRWNDIMPAGEGVPLDPSLRSG
jgi:putative endonuclease